MTNSRTSTFLFGQDPRGSILTAVNLSRLLLGRIELLQDFTMTHSGDTIPWISGYKKHQTNERSFFQSFSMSFLSIHHQTS